MARPPTKTSLTRTNDVLFSRLVRLRGRCERCGKADYEQLQCAHIHTRKYKALRWEEINAICLCASCHRYFHDQPAHFGEWIDARYGKDRRKELDMALRSPRTYTLTDFIKVKQVLEDKLKNSP